MAKNKLTDLNNHLFAQLERLSDEGLSEKQLVIEVERSKSITEVSKQIIDNAKTTLAAAKLVVDGDLRIREVPQLIGMADNTSD